MKHIIFRKRRKRPNSQSEKNRHLLRRKWKQKKNRKFGSGGRKKKATVMRSGSFLSIKDQCLHQSMSVFQKMSSFIIMVSKGIHLHICLLSWCLVHVCLPGWFQKQDLGGTSAIEKLRNVLLFQLTLPLPFYWEEPDYRKVETLLL